MKQTFYILENKSASEGTYYMNGRYNSIFPGERIELTSRPVNKTENVIITVYTKNVGETVLRKITK